MKARRTLSWRAAAASLAATAAMLLSGCVAGPADAPAAAPPTTVAAAELREPVTILVSIDGFRPDYLERGLTPALSALARRGVTASMRPSFPSKTFPNHWAEVTGYVPDHNGIVANSFTDPSRAEDKFTMATTDPYFWNGREPIWVTAEKAGIRTAAMFWPGSAVAYGGEVVPDSYGKIEGGTRPQDWTAFDQAVSPTQRVNTVIDWLRRPADIRPQFVTLYFDEVDTAGHESGPDGAAVNEAIAAVDQDIAALLAGLEALGQPANLIITSDHGMAETRTSRTVELDRVIARDAYRLVEAGPYASLNPVPGREAELEAALLAPHKHMECWRKDAIPARFRYGTSPRIPAYLCLAQTGWQIFPERRSEERIGGNHGYDNFAPEMAALFIATGPRFARGKRLERFDNVDINPLIRELLDLPQDPALDGMLGPVAGALAAAE